MEKLYSKTEMTINVHLLLHVHDRIHQYGSLSFSSMAPFEAQFKLMKRIVKGTRCHFSQFFDKVLLLKSCHSFLLANKSSDVCSSLCSTLNICDNFHTRQLLSKNKIRIQHDIFCTADYRIQDSYCRVQDFYGMIKRIVDDLDSYNLVIQKFRFVNTIFFTDDDDDVSALLFETFPKFYSFVELSEEVVTVSVSDVLGKGFLIEKVFVGGVWVSLMCNLPDVYTYT